jgi:hypothetical protein
MVDAAGRTTLDCLEHILSGVEALSDDMRLLGLDRVEYRLDLVD